MDTTQISKLKQAARALKRDAGLTHTEALDQIAKLEGASDWAHLMRHTVDQPMALVTKRPIQKSKHRVFHSIQIEDMDFTAIVSELHGLFLNGPTARSGYVHGQVALGVCKITHFPDGPVRAGGRIVRPGDWWVCKYQIENRINVTSLSDDGRLALAREFGFPHGNRQRSYYNDNFLESPAFDALVDWVEQRPRLAKRAGTHSGPYIHGWYERALEVLNG